MCYKCSARARWTDQMQDNLGHNYPVHYLPNGSTIMRTDYQIEQHWYLRKSINDPNPLTPAHTWLVSIYLN